MQHPFRNAANVAPTHDRAATRHKIFEPVAVIIDELETRAHLLNISTTGALVHSVQPPKPGSAIHLEMNGRRYQASVVWSKGARFGITFGNQLSAPVVEAILR
jgi:PilZ domain